MPLEQMKSAVDFLVELDFLSQQKDGADATGTKSLSHKWDYADSR
jgi:hypothetical protein